MCVRTNTPPALAGTIGDLPPGTEYHLPNGDRFMVLALPPCADYSATVVNLRTGRITPVYSATKLGYDEKGRLYTSTYLNDWYYDAPEPGGDEDGCDLSVDPLPGPNPTSDDEDMCDLGMTFPSE